MAKCEECLWHGECQTEEDTCNDFSPAEPDIENVISENRIHFEQEWRKSITPDDDRRIYAQIHEILMRR